MDDGTTQVDHILVSRFGVFVIETKDFSGWIFASATDRTWTQVTKLGGLDNRTRPALEGRSADGGLSARILHRG